ncbi:DUF2914 domain-containing protein [Nitrosomonas communis]|uniref:DUF2914 domain-containing protein n=1 Tax=Nitrosomonas communis TaxID=44574 RepID=UPI003D2E15EE
MTSAIQQPEPIDNIDHVWLAQDQDQDQEISINWFYQNKEVAKIPLVIKNDDWCTHSHKILNKTQFTP